jgi:REP element-mobilizing transposase RayT
MFLPIAWMLTWTTYGTWVHGAPRGSIDRHAKRPVSKFVKPDFKFEALRRSQLKHPPLLIEPDMRKVIREAIEQDCKFRKWHLYALNVRTNHVHVVVPNAAPEDRMLHTLKARPTRALREKRLVARDRRVWTPGGSKTWLLDEEELGNAIHYVLYQQGNPLPEE